MNSVYLAQALQQVGVVLDHVEPFRCCWQSCDPIRRIVPRINMAGDTVRMDHVIDKSHGVGKLWGASLDKNAGFSEEIMGHKHFPSKLWTLRREGIYGRSPMGRNAGISI